MAFNKNVLHLDASSEVERIVNFVRQTVRQVMHKQGCVLGISGGVDSSVVLALCIKAFNPGKVIPIIMPEKDSDPESEKIARMLADKFDVEPLYEDITQVLDGFRCYPRRDEAIKRIFPEYNAEKGYLAKIVLPQDLLEEGTLNLFSLTIVNPDGTEKSQRLPIREYYQIVAASNFKQRSRMAMLYYHAELRNYAVIGTGNMNEHYQGFFVKYGDGGADIQPIVHLYKTQIYQLAEYLDIPEVIRNRTPTSDTYSAHTSQQEFFFRLPFEIMDLIWYAQEHDVPVSEVAQVMDLTEEQVSRVYNDLQRKNRTTEYLRLPPFRLTESADVFQNNPTN